jgi:hypothetical protein
VSPVDEGVDYLVFATLESGRATWLAVGRGHHADGESAETAQTIGFKAGAGQR